MLISQLELEVAGRRLTIGISDVYPQVVAFEFPPGKRVSQHRIQLYLIIVWDTIKANLTRIAIII
jgi:hypothetical protein